LVHNSCTTSVSVFCSSSPLPRASSAAAGPLISELSYDAVGYGRFGADAVFAGEGEPTPGQAVFLPERASEMGMLAALATLGCLASRRSSLPDRRW
jgi:hypothetical protein